MKDNPIASSRRNTPVQVQGQRAAVNQQEPTQQPLFPDPPVQRYNPTVIPRIGTNYLAPQVEERESRERSQKSPQNQKKEVRTPMSKQPPQQRSCQDVRMDPHYQNPPQYAEINYHRPSPQMPVEVNEMGPTIQQGVIQRPVQRHTQATGERTRGSTVPVNTQQTMSVPNLQINESRDTCERDRKQECDPDQNGYVLNCIHKNRPLTLNDVGRPVFVNHYYAGEVFIPITSKKLIKLDECDVSTENSLRNVQQQGAERECREYSQNSRVTWQQDKAERGQVQRHGNATLHSELMTPVSGRNDAAQKERNVNRGIHSKFIEYSQQSLGAMNVAKSRVQAADQMNTRHIPLTGYENFRQELQTYPVSRNPMTVQPTGVDNVSSSAILDLPNVNTNLPPPLLPNPSSHHQHHHNQVHQTEVNPGQVTNSEILKSIQSITEVMHQQLLLNSKTTEQGIVQTASLFQEMIKAQEKETWILRYLRYPPFREKPKTDHNVWTGCQELRMCATNQDVHFARNSLINQAFWCKTLFEVLTKGLRTVNLQRRFYSFSLTFP